MRYSNDLRKVAMKLLEDGNTDIEVSKTLAIGIKTLKEWVAKHKNGTLYDIIAIGGHPVMYDMEGLEQFVKKYPDKYIREIQTEFFQDNGQKASMGGIHKALKKLDLRFKKNSTLQRRQSKNRSA